MSDNKDSLQGGEMDRRDVLKVFSAAALVRAARAAAGEFEIRVSPVSEHTLRITLGAVPDDGALVRAEWAAPIATLRPSSPAQELRHAGLRVAFTPDPATFRILDTRGAEIQRIAIDRVAGAFSFQTGDAPLLGLGEGGPQFDRRGSQDRMRSGQGGYRLRTNGGRVPIPWIIGASGWALFVHQPAGAFDFTGPVSRFQPAAPAAALDLFLVAAREPATLLAEYARLTGLPELPALWTLGYQQSHRTLLGRDAILAEARMFREKRLPCDTMIFLGTGFCPSGWNTNNGEFTFNQRVFPDPQAIFDEFHREHFRVVLHVAYPVRISQMSGTVKDPCDPQKRAEQQPSCYWDMHKPVWKLGVDGWWPDEGDALDGPSRLVRNRMYWEAPQLDRPNERPFALHRNGYPGMQRYGAFLWSGDVYSTWETLRTHVAIGINTGLSGIPYWGTDIGGFVPTKEFTAELFVRWFQFGAFCPLFRSHGRNWTLRLPWGWNTGDPGPIETSNYNGAALPDASQLHNAAVEPICRKYLELRYRLLPYVYSAVREATVTGMPIMRALWLHYPDDPAAVARGDVYLWGRDMLVAPVVDQGAAERRLYLPRGDWYDFWSGERMAGGREVTRAVDLETMPLYVRAGAVLPLGPVKQFTGEKVDAPVEVTVYPGADGAFLLYDDDGASFAYRKGEWTGIRMAWNERRRSLSLRLDPGSKMIGPPRHFSVRTAGREARAVTFSGRPVEVRL
ncbi:MAG TPA: TIM-barrel domain-containing protein [Bryobacteraceae bacterium]|nr:TIM-barrel domain-containing protein [Bryobacteraceae bacterium]